MSRPSGTEFYNDTSEPVTQCGALCFRMHRGQVQVLLITSRETGRWIIPKGWPHVGASASGSAQAEAWEEAGVEGSISEEPLGAYSYGKVLKPGVVQPCVVAVFALRVARLRAKFPERNERRRKWFTATRAARKVVEPELRLMLTSVAADPRLLDGAAKA